MSKISRALPLIQQLSPSAQWVLAVYFGILVIGFYCGYWIDAALGLCFLIVSTFNLVSGGAAALSFSLMLAAGIPAINAVAINRASFIVQNLTGLRELRLYLKEMRLLPVFLVLLGAVGGLYGSTLAFKLSPKLFSWVGFGVVVGVSFMMYYDTQIRAWIDYWAKKRQDSVNWARAIERACLIGLLAWRVGDWDQTIGWIVFIALMLLFLSLPGGRMQLTQIWVRFILAILIIASYGGLIGGGMASMFRAAIQLCGVTISNPKQIAALQTCASFGVNLLAAFYFTIEGEMPWRLLFVAIVGAGIGGKIGGNLLANSSDQDVGKIMGSVGFVLAGILFARLFYLYAL